jgi:cytochrome c peroxidase
LQAGPINVPGGSGVARRPVNLRARTDLMAAGDPGPTFFWDGRATSLEEQVLGPLGSPDELNMPVDVLASKLRAVPAYVLAFEQAYPGSGLTARNVQGALAAFVRSLVSGGSPFDRALAGEEGALGPEARRGMDLFYGRAACSTCHSGPHLSDGKFHNTGVPGDDRGRAAFDRVGEFQMRPYPFFQTQKAFKTPGLRNVALTAPYMHDGSEPSLEEVVRFYNRGGKERESYGLAPDIRPLDLGDQQIADLVAFLESLTSKVEVARPVIPGANEGSSFATSNLLRATVLCFQPKPFTFRLTNPPRGWISGWPSLSPSFPARSCKN